MEHCTMNSSSKQYARSTTSAPLDQGSGSGDGSVMATIISRGGAVSRVSQQGTFRPFGQDIGTADDTTLLTVQVKIPTQ